MHGAIGIEHRDVRATECRGGSRLAHPDAACQSEDHHCARQVGGHEPPKLVVHPGFNAEPGAEAGDGLMQQHAEALDTAQASGAGGRQQWRFQRHIDIVSHHERDRRLRQVEIERLMSDHAKRRGIYHQGMVGKCRPSGVPFGDAQPRQVACQRLGASKGAVGHGHRRADILQRRGHCACRTAGTEQQHWSRRGVDAMRAQISDEAIAIGVAAGDPAVSEHKSVDRACALSGLVDRIADSKAASLCGIVTLAPANPAASNPRIAAAKRHLAGSATECRPHRCHGAAARTHADVASGNT